jgi:hypothetical protein
MFAHSSEFSFSSSFCDPESVFDRRSHPVEKPRYLRLSSWAELRSHRGARTAADSAPVTQRKPSELAFATSTARSESQHQILRIELLKVDFNSAPDRRSEPDRRSIVDRLSPVADFSRSLRTSTPLRRSLPARRPTCDRFSSTGMTIPNPHQASGQLINQP